MLGGSFMATALIMLISVIVSISFALVSLNWFFRDGEDSTRSFQEFTDSQDGYGTEWVTTKFGLWLLVAAIAGCLCFFVLSIAWQWLRHHL
jgi:Na+/H+ antiporter NhaD/arsenite permease-like protein